MRFASPKNPFSKSILLGLLMLPLPVLAAPQGAKGAPAATSEKEATRSDEPTEYRFEFGLLGGYHFFNSKSGLGRFTDSPADLSPKSNVAFGSRLALNFNPWVSVEAEGLAIFTHTVDNQTKLWAFGYGGSLIVHLVGSGPVRPFISLGARGMTTLVDKTAVVANDTDGMLYGGVGFKIAMGEHAGLRLEGPHFGAAHDFPRK